MSILSSTSSGIKEVAEAKMSGTGAGGGAEGGGAAAGGGGAGDFAEAGKNSRARADAAAGTRSGTGGVPQRRCVRSGGGAMLCRFADCCACCSCCKQKSLWA